MPLKGPAYPIDATWQKRVRDAMKAEKISQNELARRAGISNAAMSDALAKDAVQTTTMAKIHKALGWDVPPLVLSPDKLELLKIYEGLDDMGRGAVLERARMAREQARGKVKR